MRGKIKSALMVSVASVVAVLVVAQLINEPDVRVWLAGLVNALRPVPEINCDSPTKQDAAVCALEKCEEALFAAKTLPRESKLVLAKSGGNFSDRPASYSEHRVKFQVGEDPADVRYAKCSMSGSVVTWSGAIHESDFER